MSIKINFDSAHNPEKPTLVLATRNGTKLGQIAAEDIIFNDALNSASEISFKVHKYVNEEKYELWDNIVNFKLLWIKEYDTWFQITLDISESNETTKSVIGTRLGEAELSQINLYDIQINTEDDIARDDYKITVLYNEVDPKASLLNRILEKAPHYTIKHVDATIKSIQRTFEFDNTSIYDAFQEIGEEIGCLFILESGSDSDGNIQRTISVYDLQSYCYECGHRGEFTLKCPECGSENISEGYGEDTTIFVTADELGQDIQLSTDTDSVKNCFKLVAGDDLMTSTIRNSNPNGSDYIWYISDDIKKDMSGELVDKLNQYDEEYEYYERDFVPEIELDHINGFNDLVDKYKIYNEELRKIVLPIKGYSELMNSVYKTIDFSLYLRSVLMPSIDIDDTSATEQCAKLTSAALSPISVEDVSKISLATANSAVLLMAKVIVDSRYQTKVNESNFENQIWTGNFEVTNYSDENDTSISETITITIDDNYESFVKQKIDKALSKEPSYDPSIIALFDMDETDFKNELKKYCLNRLTSFHDSCQACIDILIEQGIADKETWSGSDPNLYDDLYIPYYNKLQWISEEMALREQELSVIVTLNNLFVSIQQNIQDKLNLENYLGTKLWLELSSYRREDEYNNSNYISDGLSDTELFDKAQEFIAVAEKEIYKSAELQHSISCGLNNLLTVEKFEPLIQGFRVGNWIRILIDDRIYKLRLISYEIDYGDLISLSVDFSDVMKTADGLSDEQSVISSAKSMSTSYNSTKRQASQGLKSKEQLNDWVEKGLSLTTMKIVNNADNQNISWDSHGILGREYLPVTDTYDDRQIKIINRGVYLTDDNWLTSKAGIGSFTFWNPRTQKMESAYGVIADKLVGNLILSENVGIYNENNSITLDSDGLTITSVSNDNDLNYNLFTIRKHVLSESAQANEYVSRLIRDGILSETSSFDFDTQDIESINQQIEFLMNLTLNDEPLFIDVVDESGISVKELNPELSDVKGFAELQYIYSVLLNKKADIEQGTEEEDLDQYNDLLYINDNGDLVLNGSININTVSEDSSTLNDLLDPNRFTDSFTEIIQNTVNSSVENAANSLDEEYQQQIDELRTNLYDYQTSVGQYLQFNESGLTIGALTSAFSTLINNDGMYFKQADTTVAYINNNQLYIPNAVIQNTLTLGKFFFSPRVDGGVSLVWQGD